MDKKRRFLEKKTENCKSLTAAFLTRVWASISRIFIFLLKTSVAFCFFSSDADIRDLSTLEISAILRFLYKIRHVRKFSDQKIAENYVLCEKEVQSARAKISGQKRLIFADGEPQT
jgi:hypothetical protein